MSTISTRKRTVRELRALESRHSSPVRGTHYLSGHRQQGRKRTWGLWRLESATATICSVQHNAWPQDNTRFLLQLCGVGKAGLNHPQKTDVKSVASFYYRQAHICCVRVCVCVTAESIFIMCILFQGDHFALGSQLRRSFQRENSPTLRYHLLPKETDANVEGEILMGSSLDVYWYCHCLGIDWAAVSERQSHSTLLALWLSQSPCPFLHRVPWTVYRCWSCAVEVLLWAELPVIHWSLYHV